MGQRVSIIIDHFGVKKVQFADAVGIHQAYISQIISDKKVPSDRVINDICEAYNISEHWLRTGEGDMLQPKSERDLPAELSRDPMVRAILEAYLDLDPQGRQMFQAFFADVVARYNGADTADTIDADDYIHARATPIIDRDTQ